MATVIEKTEEGSFIPASQRPDGSWRKPRRVKEGYIPQEEVPLYESKGKQWASKKPMYPVGLDPALIKAHEAAKASKNPIPGMVIDTNSGKSKKKKKKKSSDTSKEVGKPSELTPANMPSAQNTKLESEKKSNNETNTNVASSNTSAAVTTDPAKRLKNLRKKLREIEAIEKKISNGEIKAPDKDQKEKVSRKPDVLSEIMALELSLQN